MATFPRGRCRGLVRRGRRFGRRRRAGSGGSGGSGRFSGGAGRGGGGSGGCIGRGGGGLGRGLRSSGSRRVDGDWGLWTIPRERRAKTPDEEEMAPANRQPHRALQPSTSLFPRLLPRRASAISGRSGFCPIQQSVAPSFAARWSRGGLASRRSSSGHSLERPLDLQGVGWRSTDRNEGVCGGGREGRLGFAALGGRYNRDHAYRRRFGWQLVARLQPPPPTPRARTHIRITRRMGSEGRSRGPYAQVR